MKRLIIRDRYTGRKFSTGITYYHSTFIVEEPKYKDKPYKQEPPSYDVTFFYLPQNIELSQVTKPRDVAKYLWVVSTLYLERVKNKKIKKEDFVPLKMETLRQWLTTKKATKILSDLKTWGVIESDGIWHKGSKSTGYKLTAKYVHQPFKRVEVTDKLIIKKTAKWKEQQRLKAKAAGGTMSICITIFRK